MRPPGYRLPAATRLGPVRLQVSSLDRSIGYYQQVLGLRIINQTESRATLGPDGPARSLVELHTRPGVTPAPRRATLGLYHLAILLPDRASLGRFIQHLANLGARAGMADHLVSEAIYLTDPDGLGIEVYADRPRETWRAVAPRLPSGRPERESKGDGELAMTTEPLDAEAVVEAGRGEPWTGMPQGAVMGHVHLHVGDLERGAAFYHAGLGFDKIVWSYPGALFLSAGGYHHHLGTNTWAHGPNPAPDQARLLSWDVIVPRVEDADAAARSLAAAGYAVDRDGSAWSAADPWGTVVRIVPAAQSSIFNRGI